ncbi:MAG: DNRLRE domain-containing protein [Planctomycetota bacterium]|nr:DNRLRE domain-containing protein [Planctomycetota bacterium]
MKFYFCEKCGKRLTEGDLAQGQARDKQARGIFCSDCAQNVMTMEFSSLNEEQARKIIQETSGEHAAPRETPARPSGLHETPARPGKRRSTGVAIQARAASERHIPPAKPAARAPRAGGPKDGSALLLLAGGAGLLLLLGLLFAFSGGQPAQKTAKPGEPPVPERKTSLPGPPARKTEPAPPDAPAVEPKTAQTAEPIEPVETEGPEPAPPVSAEAAAEKAFETFEQAWKNLPADDRPARMALAEAFLAQHGATLYGARVRTMAAQADQPAPAPESQPAQPARASSGPPIIASPPGHKAPPERLVAEAATAKPAPPDPAWNAKLALARFHAPFLDLLRKGDAPAARKVLDAALQDAALAPVHAACAAHEQALAWLETFPAARKAGLESLKDEPRAELKRADGSILRLGREADLQLLEVRASALAVGGKGISLEVPFEQLDPGALREMTLRGLPKDASGSLRRALVNLLQAEPGRAPADDAELRKAEDLGADPGALAYLKGLYVHAAQGPGGTEAALLLERFDALKGAEHWGDAAELGRLLLDKYAETPAVKARADLRRALETLAQRNRPIWEYNVSLQLGDDYPEAGIKAYKAATCLFMNPSTSEPPGLRSQQLRAGKGHAIFLRFGLSAADGGPLPAGVEVLEARLCLLCNDHTGIQPLAVRRVLEDWDPASATWTQAKAGQSWSTPGGPVSDPPTARYDPAVNRMQAGYWLRINVTADVQAMLDEGRNFGWRIESAAEGATATSFDFWGPDTGNRSPKLALRLRGPRPTPPRPTPPRP